MHLVWCQASPLALVAAPSFVCDRDHTSQLMAWINLYFYSDLAVTISALAGSVLN